MYSSPWKGVNGAAWVVLALFPLTSGHAQVVPTPTLSGVVCDTALQALFTPPFPHVGRYEVCVSPKHLSALVPSSWPVREQDALDAFGAAGPYNRAALARLYGGQPALVARGWIDEAGQFESRTYLSPYPDATLARLIPGTLIVRFIICCT